MLTAHQNTCVQAALGTCAWPTYTGLHHKEEAARKVADKERGGVLAHGGDVSQAKAAWQRAFDTAFGRTTVSGAFN